jgi:hypothetical protein
MPGESIFAVHGSAPGHQQLQDGLVSRERGGRHGRGRAVRSARRRASIQQKPHGLLVAEVGRQAQGRFAPLERTFRCATASSAGVQQAYHRANGREAAL